MLSKLFHLRQYRFSRTLDHIPTLSGFMQPPVVQASQGRKYYIETYGCQMNENDSQIVAAILQREGFSKTSDQESAEVVLLNTCAIRANAESKILTRLGMLRAKKHERPDLVIGILGCMAERLKQSLWEQGADIVAGPDSYRNLPAMLAKARQQVDTQLTWDETYEDFMPVIERGSLTSYVSIMRGCNNMCSFCIVPFTRGRERSRSPASILAELENLRAQGVKEVTLLGQNVNSYFYRDEAINSVHENAEGFNELYKLRHGNGMRFAQLLETVAQAAPDMRIRFTSPHPKDFSEQVLSTIAKYPNIAKNVHVPAQSGSSSMLQRMRRNYTREALVDLCRLIRSTIPGVTLSTDLIVGFCDETEEEFQDTLSLVDEIKFETAFMFAYSMRERTHAHRNYTDNVPEEVKQARLRQLIDRVHLHQKQINQLEIGRQHLVLVDSKGKKENQLKGRTDTNKSVVFEPMAGIELGDFVVVEVASASQKTLMATPIRKSTIQEFAG